MPRAMPNKKFLAMIQRFTAVQAVGPSAVRGQARNTLRTIQEYLGQLKLKRLPNAGACDYARWLDAQTRRLQACCNGTAWGVARKAMNLFMRSCLYNTYLSRMFHLARIQRYMEIPLDSVVAKGLKKEAKIAGREPLPRWKGLTGLGPEESQQFQNDANECARCVGLRCRVFLDNYLWLKYRRR
ncbi:MAG: hypothetical protein FJ288_16740 [Planctomycetes bacterium]|nr:hypothetical protein [Planctomycetota bacterium]